MFSLGQDFIHLIELATFLQFRRQPDSCQVTSEWPEKGLVEDWVDLPGGGEDELVCGIADFSCDQEWTDGLWSEFRSGETKREISGIKIDQVSRLVIVGLTHMLVVRVLVLYLGIQQDFPELLPNLPEI